jgi:hypothetical protein
LTPRGRYWAYTLGIAWLSKLRGVACIGSTWADVDMRVEVVGGRDTEIRWGVGVLLQKGGYRAYTLNIISPSQMQGGACRGSTGGDVDAKFEGTVGVERKNERGEAFGAPNQKLSLGGSVSVWGVQVAKGLAEKVHVEGHIWWLQWWGACNSAGSGRNT